MTPVRIDTDCAVCAGYWREPRDYGRGYHYCPACVDYDHASAEHLHVGQRCAGQCGERIPQDAERVVCADGGAWHMGCLADARIAARGGDDSDDACAAEAQAIACELAERTRKWAATVDGSFALACDAVGGLLLAAMIAAPWVL